ncbi:MAG TPA: hypothetical protein DER40_13670 [Geobacter sp.]|nr:hypothetical protein [Geobacter sp.]
MMKKPLNRRKCRFSGFFVINVITQRNFNLKKAINRREKRMHADKTCTYIKKLITLWVKPVFGSSF